MPKISKNTFTTAPRWIQTQSHTHLFIDGNEVLGFVTFDPETNRYYPYGDTNAYENGSEDLFVAKARVREDLARRGILGLDGIHSLNGVHAMTTPTWPRN